LTLLAVQNRATQQLCENAVRARGKLRNSRGGVLTKAAAPATAISNHRRRPHAQQEPQPHRSSAMSGRAPGAAPPLSSGRPEQQQQQYPPAQSRGAPSAGYYPGGSTGPGGLARPSRAAAAAPAGT